MKLRAIRKDRARSEGGVWWDLEQQERVDSPNAHLCLLVAEAGNPRHRESMAKGRLARFADFKAGGEEAHHAERDVTDIAMSETLLLDWRNMEDDDGAAIEYSHEKALELIRDPSLFALRQFVLDVSGIASSYRWQQEEAAKGN